MNFKLFAIKMFKLVVMALHFIPPPRETASVLQMLAVGLTMRQTCWSVKVSGFQHFVF